MSLEVFATHLVPARRPSDDCQAIKVWHLKRDRFARGARQTSVPGHSEDIRIAEVQEVYLLPEPPTISSWRQDRNRMNERRIYY